MLLPSTTRGLAFLEVVAESPADEVRCTEMIATFLVVSLAEEVLHEARRPSLGAIAETRTHLIPLDDPAKYDPAKHARLSSLVDLIATCDPTDRAATHDIGRLLLILGVELHAAGQFRPAIGVFTLIGETLFLETDLLLQSLGQQGFALRQLARPDEAELVYRQMARVAREARDPRMHLEALQGMLRVVVGRGDYPRAERLALRLIRQARRQRQRGILANAMTDLSAVLGARRNLDAALYYATRAIRLADSPEVRARAMQNAAMALRERGRIDMAERVAGAIGAIATGTYVSLDASLLLYQLSLDRRDRVGARRHRRALAASTLPPALAAEFLGVQARDYALNDRFDDARAMVHAMVAYAEKHALNEMASRAERALADLAQGLVPALYDFRPELTDDCDQERRLVKLEGQLRALCPA